MEEHADFWKGLVTGALAGMVIAAYSQWNLSFGTQSGSRELKRGKAPSDIQGGSIRVAGEQPAGISRLQRDVATETASL